MGVTENIQDAISLSTCSPLSANGQDSKRCVSESYKVTICKRQKYFHSISFNEGLITTTSPKVAVIGVGSRGLSILERLAANYDQNKNYILNIYLIDPGRYPGQGIHSSEQSPHLLINTVACQVTMFLDESITNCGPIRKGPSLFDWAREENYRKMPNGQYMKGCDGGSEIEPNDYLPRQLLGEYLRWVYDYLVSNLPSGIIVHHYNQTVIDIHCLNDGGVKLFLNDGCSFNVDCAVLTTGHDQNALDNVELHYDQFVNECRSMNPHLRYLRAYPLSQLQSIDQHSRVAIQGLGLSCHDVLSELTCGRGGQFVYGDNDELTYIRSGHEPEKIYVYSRNCLPFSARGRNEKSVGGQYQARFFTRAMIDQLREENGYFQLDFEKQVLPVLINEMCYVYECTLRNNWLVSHDEFEPSEETRQVIHRLLYPLDNVIIDYNSFTFWIIDFIEQDLDEAYLGNVSSPVKAATDLLRDVRDTIRYTVDFRGLTPRSHQYFIENICPVMNRIAVGPPKERNIQLLALIRAGVVEFACVPNAQPRVRCDRARASFVIESKSMQECIVDVLIKGMMESFYPERNNSCLIRNMLKRGLIRPFSNGDYRPGGIDINENQNLISAEGLTIQNIWALGNIVEGPNFYTYVLPRPLVNSRALQDAGKCVFKIFSLLDKCLAPSN